MSAAAGMDPRLLEELFAQIGGLHETLGLTFSVEGPGAITTRLPLTTRHLGSPLATHGGAVSAMMDTTLGMTALSYLVPQGRVCSTVEFKINYLTPSRPGELLLGHAQIDHAGRRLIIVSGTICEAASGRQVARGIGTFNAYETDMDAWLQTLA